MKYANPWRLIIIQWFVYNRMNKHSVLQMVEPKNETILSFCANHWLCCARIHGSQKVDFY